MKVEGKTCKKCGEWKGFGEFYKDKRNKDECREKCKKCIKQYQKKNAERLKKYRQENAEQFKEYERQYYQENIERIKGRKKQHYQENAERLKETCKQYQQKNPERYKEYRKQYLQTERGRESFYRSNLKRKSYKHKVNFTPHERKVILDRDNWKCCNCGIKVHDRSTGDWNTPDKAHIDHIIPLSKGGNSEPSNLQTLCRTCNLSKNNKIELQLSLF